jgi:hypothetical protein
MASGSGRSTKRRALHKNDCHERIFEVKLKSHVRKFRYVWWPCLKAFFLHPQYALVTRVSAFCWPWAFDCRTTHDHRNLCGAGHAKVGWLSCFHAKDQVRNRRQLGGLRDTSILECAVSTALYQGMTTVTCVKAARCRRTPRTLHRASRDMGFDPVDAAL